MLGRSADNEIGRAEDRFNEKYKEAIGRLGQYTAPALLTFLMSGKAVRDFSF